MRTRSGGGFGAGFSTATMATRLTLFIAALSILVAILQRAGAGNLLDHLLFTPAHAVQRFELWQILSYALIIPLSGPLSGPEIFFFLITLYFLYSVGNQVEAVLGSRRFLGFYLGTVALGAILTIPIAYLFGFQLATYSGLWAGLGALVILFAHNFGNQPVYLMFVLPVKGRQLIYVAFGIVALYAILLEPWSRVLPAFFSMLAALAFAYGLFQPRRAWLRFRAWRIERELKRRTRKFSVIDGEKKSKEDVTALFPRKRDEKDKDPWLH